MAALLPADGRAAEGPEPALEQIAGEILDTAVAHCRLGQQKEALAMLQAIRAQLDPPPAILRLVTDLEATGCAVSVAGASAPGHGLRAQLGAGWDSNVSQGISARTLVLGRDNDAIELELGESYRPRPSEYVAASIDYTLQLPAGFQLQAALGQRTHAREPDFDLGTVSGSVAREFSVGRMPLRLQVDLAEIWLGNKHYLRSQGASLLHLRPDGDGAWLASLSAGQVRYLTQPMQNARQFELGLLREQRLGASASVHVRAALLHDEALATRPGGDRTGYQVQLGATAAAGGWRFKSQWVYTRMASPQVFAPGLLDVRRRNALTQLALQAERPLTPQTSLLLEARGRWSRDTVPLYRYQARSVSATLAHRF